MAEKRGRLAFDLEQTTQIAADVNRRVATLQLDLEAMDRALNIFDPSIKPNEIQPVHAHRPYGKRGAFRDCILRVLQQYAVEWTSTENVEMLVRLELGLTFETLALRKRWYDNSLKKQLKRLVKEGLVERLHSGEGFTAELGHWRWKREREVSLAELQTQADQR